VSKANGSRERAPDDRLRVPTIPQAAVDRWWAQRKCAFAHPTIQPRGETPTPSLRGAQRRSNPCLSKPKDGWLRGACHRAARSRGPVGSQWRMEKPASRIQGRRC